MVPSMWGSVSTYRQHSMLNGATAIRTSYMACLANATRLSSGRQARRSICTTTIEWLLHHHVKLPCLLGLAFHGCFRIWSSPSRFPSPHLSYNSPSVTQEIILLWAPGIKLGHGKSKLGWVRSSYGRVAFAMAPTHLFSNASFPQRSRTTVDMEIY